VLHGAVLVDVAGDAERRQLAHLVGVRDRAAEDQDRQPSLIQLADRSHELHPGIVRQPQIQHDQIDVREIGEHARHQLGRALDDDRLVACVLDRRAESIAHERGIVGDDDGLRRDRGTGHLRSQPSAAR
jgi:hypothetical protein